ncbi:MAG TPA: hypothetical protein VIG35_09045 [Gaiellaceae bacterium]
MGLFKREPLHERLARQGGLIERPPQGDPRPLWQEPGVTGLYRPRAADVVVTTQAPDVEGDAVRFVSLPDGTLLVEEGADSPLDPLAAAVEQELKPPYRARAVRRGEALWAVEAKRIEVLAIPDAPGGDAIDLTRTADGTTLAVDDQRIFGTLPVLAARGEREGSEYTVHADRLDGDLWEVRAAAL